MGFFLPNASNPGASTLNTFQSADTSFSSAQVDDGGSNDDCGGDTSQLQQSNTSGTAGLNVENAAAALGAILSAFSNMSTPQVEKKKSAPPNVQVGIFADDNGISSGSATSSSDTTNHQAIDAQTILNARSVTGKNSNVHVNSQQTNTENGAGVNETVNGTFANGQAVTSSASAGKDPSASSLADFVDQTLNNSQKNNASTTTLELQGHANAQSMLVNSSGSALSTIQIGEAIKSGTAMHEKEHPGDSRKINTVVLNGCGANSAGFANQMSSAGVDTVVGSSNSNYPLSQSFLPLLTDASANASGIAHRAAQGQNAPNTADGSLPSPEVSVQQVGHGKGNAIASTTVALDNAFGAAASSSSSQQALIKSTLDSVASESQTTGFAGDTLNKNSIKVDNAILGTAGITNSVKAAASKNEQAVRASTIGQANNTSTANAIGFGSGTESGTSMPVPTESAAAGLIADGNASGAATGWITQVFGK